jgi:phospholipase/lecithinase/hemolysin
MVSRRFIAAFAAALTFAGPAAANVITSLFTSLYILGDSLSDDGNVNGIAWAWTTGGSPYQGNWRDGGTFTNGDVWNEPLQNDFRNAGRDADNFALGSAGASGGNWLIPDLDGQIDDLLDSTSKGDRGKNPLVAIGIGGNDVLNAVGDGDAVEVAVAAAKTVGKGIKRLASAAGIDEFVLFNLPDLGNIPEFRLFDQNNRSKARAAVKAYNAELAKRVRSLEKDGLNIIDIDLYGLFADVLADPSGYGFANVKLPCVFPSEKEADKYGQPERCSKSIAEKRLFMDSVHPNALAHSIVGDVVKDALKAEVRSRTSAPLAMLAAYPEPVSTPLPASWALLGGAVGAFASLRVRKRRRAARAR